MVVDDAAEQTGPDALITRMTPEQERLLLKANELGQEDLFHLLRLLLRLWYVRERSRSRSSV